VIATRVYGASEISASSKVCAEIERLQSHFPHIGTGNLS
jgi:hypothetical protein